MALVNTPTLTDVYTKLKAFLVVVTGLDPKVIVQGLGNRVPTPLPAGGWVAMTATALNPHRTPVELFDHDAPNPDAIAFEQGTLVRIQCDCYGPTSQEWAVSLMTTLRTSYACDFFAPFAPLYADNPIQAALTNAEAQYEQRWIVGANLQYNPVVSTPMEFADTLEANLINVDERFPP